MSNARRRGNNNAQFHQGGLSVEVAQPTHTTFLSVPHYDQSWNGNFVHLDPAVDNSHDSMMAPPPTTLSLSVPGNANYMPNTMLYSPGSDSYSQSHVSESYMLPSYGNSLMDGHGDNVFAKLDPALQSAALSPSETMKSSFDGHEKHERYDSIDPEVKTKDLSPSSSHSSTVHMNAKQRAAHRKNIEEKSSMKRKLAEQRLSRAISSRLGGTFVPGLANQMNQAADIIERDTQTIQALEAELNRLRQSAGVDVQRKFRN